MSVALRIVPFTDPAAQSLVAELDQDMRRRYGEGDATAVDPSQFDSPTGTFMVLDDEGPAGCVGVRPLPGTAGTCEIKRMWVREDRRRRGHARRLLAAAEQFARSAGHTRIVLETGELQPESMALYEAYGFSRIPAYGYYRDDPECVCYGLDLPPEDAV
ncbi:GNAT family N-acetyltransferase [Calidifontibacter terrae]